MFLFLLACAWIAAPALSPVSAYASPLTLRGALELAEAGNPSLRADRFRAAAAGARAGDASRRPNPVLGLTAENLGGALGTDRAETTLLLEQSLELGGDRPARAGLARSLASVAEAERAATRRNVLASTAERFLDAWALQERVARLRDAERAGAEAVRAADERHRAGGTPRYEVVRARNFLALLEVSRRRAAAELAVTRRRLALQWGADSLGSDSLALGSPPDPAAANLAGLADDAKLTEADPEWRLAAAEADAEAWRLRAARAARVPDLSLSAGARHLAEAGGTGALVGVSVPLPFWNPGHGPVEAARLERAAAEQRAAGAAHRAREALRGATDRYLAAWDAWERISRAIRPAAEEALELVVAAYRAGRVGYVDIQDAQRGLTESALLEVEAATEVWKARKGLELIAGVTLDEIESRRDDR